MEVDTPKVTIVDRHRLLTKTKSSLNKKLLQRIRKFMQLKLVIGFHADYTIEQTTVVVPVFLSFDDMIEAPGSD